MKNFDEFVGKNKSALFSFAEKNTEYDARGRAVITFYNSWLDENGWDEAYNRLMMISE